MAATMVSTSGIGAVCARLDRLGRRMPEIAGQIARGLAEEGYQVAYEVLSNYVFNGDTLSSLSVESTGEGRYVLFAESRAILFLEFGAGVRYAASHPWGEETGMGPGSYSPKGHWDDPDGWWFETDDPRLIVHTSDATGQGFGHTYGNPPRMPFYRADRAMREKILEVSRRAFAND